MLADPFRKVLNRLAAHFFGEEWAESLFSFIE